jgi:N-acetylmuramoyl-L-alanine amidase
MSDYDEKDWSDVMPLRVCIDAGHGGNDRGAVNGKRYEKDDTLRLALLVGKTLRQNGVDVVYTRTDDIYSSPANKAKITNLLKADYLLCIHRNGSFSKKNSGIKTYVYNKKGMKYKIATTMNDNVAAIGFCNNGVRTGKTLAVLNRTNMHAILISIGYITNDNDNKLFDSRFDEIANTVAKSFLETLGLTYKTSE